MTDSVRAGIAVMAGALSSKCDPHAIFDQQNHAHYHFTGHVTDRDVRVENHHDQSRLTGNGLNGDFTLFTTATKSQITFHISGYSFSGYDALAKKHFRGSVQGNRVTIFDEEQRKMFTYLFEVHHAQPQAVAPQPPVQYH